jgi:16S rRNA (cytosine1402-N4)-methyltransferase
MTKKSGGRRDSGLFADVHQSVMVEEVIAALRPKAGGEYVDLTVGVGGHARRILEASAPDGKLLGIDRDPEILGLAKKNLESFGDRVRLVQGRFSEVTRFLREAGFGHVDGMLLDLGVSSLQLDQAKRGFSFQQAGPLDMRMDSGEGKSLKTCLQALSEEELATKLSTLGEVTKARFVARRILEAQQKGGLSDTTQLARVVSFGGRKGRVHPATQVFLALRRMVNQEEEELSNILEALPEPLAAGGRVLFITFHSLEDRLVKRRLHSLEGQCRCPSDFPICRCGKKALMRLHPRKAVVPSVEEVQRNPRSRSARLRVAERLAA